MRTKQRSGWHGRGGERVKWDHTGSPADLEAAAADALLWLDTFDAMVRRGRARFVSPDTLEKLGDARNRLAALLPMDARVVGVDCEGVMA